MSKDEFTRTDRTVFAQDSAGTAFGGARGPRRDAGLAPGDTLNGIYRVSRFIARGGMGDVYEGVNIESDERVAIKVMRSHLAEDPKVLGMFRKEARVLTRIAHPAIVQYRVLAREPILNLYYIVTDFIDGEPLSAHLDGSRPPLGAIVRFGLRLASGLEVAHEYGAIHRDMSPDNILLPEGRLERAKIIDFGIAKSLDVTAETIVGDGFAGKLGYVAPEQFGDYGREIGPWTDIYSMALVLLAFTRGRAPDMGRTLSDAVQRRRDGPDMTGLPLAIEAVLRKMLAPDPKDRLRSMLDVAAELKQIGADDDDDEPVAPSRPSVAASVEAGHRAPDPAPPPAPEPMASPEETETRYLPATPPSAGPAPKSLAEPAVATETAGPDRHDRLRTLLMGGGALVLAMVAGLALLLHGGGTPRQQSRPPAMRVARPSSFGTAPPPIPAAVSPLSPQEALVSTVGCTWLRGAGASGSDLRLNGGAGDIDGLHVAILAAARARHVPVGQIDLRDVVPIPPVRCGLVNALSGFDDRHDESLALLAPTAGVMMTNAPGCPVGPAAQLDLTVMEREPSRNFALFAMLPSGRIVTFISGRDQFEREARRRPDVFRDLGGGRMQLLTCYRATGPIGLILVDATGPIDLGLFGGRPTPGGAALQHLVEVARAGGWRTRAAWVRLAPAPASATPANTIPAAAAPPPSASAPVAPGTGSADATKTGAAPTPGDDGIAACRRYTGQSWEELGYTNRDTCVDRAFKNSCRITGAMFGDTPLRRYNGHIEAQRKNAWSAIGKSVCE